MSRKARIITAVIAIFVGMGIYSHPEVWGNNTSKGIDTIQTGADRGGTFLNTVLNGQMGK